MSPMQRTLEYLSKMGATPVILESYNWHSRKKRDIWGADILALHGRMFLAIQTTSDTNHSHRVTSAINDPDVKNWLLGDAGFYVYSWGLKGRGPKKTWKLKITQLSLDGDGKIRTMTHGSEIPDEGQQSQTAAM